MRLLVGVVIAFSAGSARAERAITVDVAGLAPFEADELARAIRVRLPAKGAAVHVRVAATPAGIQVQTREATRDVDIAGLGGAAAARLVALAATDLLLADLAVEPTDVGEPREEAGGATTIGAIGGVAGWERLLVGGGVEVTLPVRARVGIDAIAVELGGGIASGPVSLKAALARIGVGMRSGLFEVRVGATVAPIFVADGAGDSTLLVGGGASVRLRVPVASRARALFGVGVDAFATQTEYRINGVEVFTTPRYAPWFGAGVEVTP
ncbi:MAG TPA: hypothetical protein VIV11_02480 [Kofleriaceae bacterium]